MKWSFIVFCVFLLSLIFRRQSLPASWAESTFRRFASPQLELRVNAMSFGFREGLRLDGIRLYDNSGAYAERLMLWADSVRLDLLSRMVEVDGLCFPRLPDSYYRPGVQERNERVELMFPDLGEFQVVLTRPDILAARPKRVEADVEIRESCVIIDRVQLDWPQVDRMLTLSGSAVLNLESQALDGEVSGLATQHDIRPFLEALDIPVVLPYVDGFTEIPEPVISRCSWKVNLVNNDFDFWLHLWPTLGKYNQVPLTRADGMIHLHNYIRGTNLNYRQTIGPIVAVGQGGRPLEGRLVVEGTNGYNTVSIQAKSELPIAQLLAIGGFTGDYVGEEIFGDSECNLEFRFPRAMTNNYEVLNGKGHVVIKNGQLMRMRGFRGLLDAMPSMVPAVSWFSDSTQASCDYVIENGVVKSDNVYIEGSLFSIKMYGRFDAVRNDLDFTVRVQFTKRDSFMGKVLHPLTWPFTKLLLEFQLTGTPEHPQWRYISVLDRVIEVIE